MTNFERRGDEDSGSNLPERRLGANHADRR
jgi:hypothetical protein